MIEWKDNPRGGAARAIVGIGGEAVFTLYVGEQGGNDYVDEQDDNDDDSAWQWEVYIGDPRAHEEFRYGRCASIEAAKQAAEAAVRDLLREMLATMEAA